MNKTLLKLVSNLLFPFDRHKKLLFRGRHNSTAVYMKKLRKKGIRIGFGTFVYEGTNIRDKRSSIGKFCSIGPGVSIGTGQHPLNALSTNSMVHKICYLPDGKVGIKKENQISFEQSRPVTLGNDVWVGMNAVIMDGVNIGDGAVIGSGAIVTKDVPAYAVVGGVPAKIIRYRFDEQTIARLLNTRWWDRDMEHIENMPVADIQKCLEILEKSENIEQ